MKGNRRQLKQVMRLRTARRVLYAAGMTVAVTTATAVVVFLNLAGSDPAHARFRLYFDSADAIQETQPVLRGARNQPVLQVVVRAGGEGEPLNLHAISFSAGGTTMPVQEQVCNARLWYTGTDPDFSTRQQCGPTLPDVGSAGFSFLAGKPLHRGLNYFWLTFDIRPGARPGGRVDAECDYIQVGASRFLPFVAAPSGSRPILDNIPCYSTGLPEMTLTGAWNTRRDGSGDAVDPTTGRYTLFVQGGHRLECRSGIKVHSIYIEKGGVVRVDGPLRAALVVVGENGILREDRDTGETGRLVVCNGGMLIHDHAGALTGRSRLLYPASTVCFYRAGPRTLPRHVTWGNVLVFADLPAPLDIRQRLNEVKGDLEIRSTGTAGYLYCSGTDSIRIHGNLLVSGGVFRGAAGGVLDVRVGKAFVMKDGSFSDALSDGAGRTRLHVAGDVQLEGGTFGFHVNRTSLSELHLSGTGRRRVSWKQVACDAVLGNLFIEPGKVVILEGDRLGDIAEGCSLDVLPGGQLTCGRYPVTGNGGFVLEDSATLAIGSIRGISTDLNEGNILTATRSFSSRAYYVYHTGSTPQQTGLFRTTPDPWKIQSLAIEKDKPADEVVLSGNLTLVEGPDIRMGVLRRGVYTLRRAGDEANVRAE